METFVNKKIFHVSKFKYLKTLSFEQKKIFAFFKKTSRFLLLIVPSIVFFS